MHVILNPSMLGLLDYGKNHNHDYFGQYINHDYSNVACYVSDSKPNFLRFKFYTMHMQNGFIAVDQHCLNAPWSIILLGQLSFLYNDMTQICCILCLNSLFTPGPLLYPCLRASRISCCHQNSTGETTIGMHQFHPQPE